jgi:hypothetical protein
MKVIALILTISILYSNKTGAQKQDEEGIKSAISQFFEGMKKTDTSLIRAVIFSGARLETVLRDKQGNTTVRSENFDNFLKMIAKPHTEVYDERISFSSILVDDNLATAWTPYQFYIGDKFSHQGVNAFQLVKTREGNWMILSIIDTRRK